MGIFHCYVCLPEGTWFFIGISSSRGSFSGSMLVFGGVPLVPWESRGILSSLFQVGCKGGKAVSKTPRFVDKSLLENNSIVGCSKQAHVHKSRAPQVTQFPPVLPSCRQIALHHHLQASAEKAHGISARPCEPRGGFPYPARAETCVLFVGT